MDYFVPVPNAPQRPPSLIALPSYLASYVAAYGRASLEAELTGRGLQLTHNAVLFALSDFGPLAQQQLSDCLRIDKSHLVRYIDKLEADGLLRRDADPHDRRRHRVVLTENGRRTAATLKVAATASQQNLLGALNATEQAQLIDLLTRVLAANDADQEPAAAG